MDRVLSVRVDENAFTRIGVLARQLHLSKKRVIEGALEVLAAKLEEGAPLDVFGKTFGAWSRKESAGTTVSKAKRAFASSMSRHRR